MVDIKSTKAIQRKLALLMMISVSERFSLLFEANLPEDIILNMNLEGAPAEAASMTIRSLIKYPDLFPKLIEFVDRKMVPQFVPTRPNSLGRYD